ncbi:type IV pilus twitching motility protein PilT [Caenimonas sedimenti]|nr:ATPase, T2SS/T4P/T4SS family [Caenimonas sedimenti]
MHGTHDKDTQLAGQLIHLLQQGGEFSDVHVETGRPIRVRRGRFMWETAIGPDGGEMVSSNASIRAFMNMVYAREGSKIAPWEDELHRVGSLNPATLLNSVGAGERVSSYRVRCSLQKQGMGEDFGLVVRSLKDVPESIEKLGLPVQLRRLYAPTNGLLVVTGPTGSGKSTTLAAIINEINESQCANIVTIEDPVEYVHERKKSAINQREVGVDTPSYADGVKDLLRFVPDVTLIGEIRDPETFLAALRIGESGHLVITSMHAPTTTAALKKMAAYVQNSPADAQALAGCLVGVLAQALVVGREKTSHLAYELLPMAPEVHAAMAAIMTDSGKGAMDNLEQSLRNGNVQGAIPMVEIVQQLVQQGKIEAVRGAAVLAAVQDREAVLSKGRAPAPEGRGVNGGGSGGLFPASVGTTARARAAAMPLR